MNVKRDDFMTSFYMCINFCTSYKEKERSFFVQSIVIRFNTETFAIWSTPSNRGIIILIWRYTNEHY
jgi:hypothetical protein